MDYGIRIYFNSGDSAIQHRDWRWSRLSCPMEMRRLSLRRTRMQARLSSLLALHMGLSIYTLVSHLSHMATYEGYVIVWASFPISRVQANILVSRTGQAQLSDFGLSKIMEAASTDTSVGMTTANAGATRWMAPELFHSEPNEYPPSCASPHPSITSLIGDDPPEYEVGASYPSDHT